MGDAKVEEREKSKDWVRPWKRREGGEAPTAVCFRDRGDTRDIVMGDKKE